MILIPRKLLIVTYNFPPSSASGSFRLLGFARHLPRFGWRTIVVAPPTLPWEPVDEALLTQVPPDTVRYSVPYRQGGLTQRIAPWSVWLPTALDACRRAIRESQPDVVLTSGPPHQVHVLGLLLKRWHDLPWCADFRDPWVSDGRPRSRWSRRAAWLERAVVRQADVVIANAPRACAVFQQAYPGLEHKFVTITNGFDREAFVDRPARDPAQPLTIVHAGAIYAGRDPRPFLDAIQAFRPAGMPLVVRLLGTPPEEGNYDLTSEIRRRRLEDVVTFSGQVTYAAALQEMMRADILLLLDSPGRKIGVPAKLYEYIGAGRPILALGESDGDLAATLEHSGLPHRIAAPTSAEEVRRALTELAAERRSAEQGGTTRFTREATAGCLADVLSRIRAESVPGVSAPTHSPGPVLECQEVNV